MLTYLLYKLKLLTDFHQWHAGVEEARTQQKVLPRL